MSPCLLRKLDQMVLQVGTDFVQVGLAHADADLGERHEVRG